MISLIRKIKANPWNSNRLVALDKAFSESLISVDADAINAGKRDYLKRVETC